VAEQDRAVEEKFLKSGRNRQTENAGLVVLLRDPRFKVVERALKASLLASLGAGGFPVQAFDAVMFEEPAPQSLRFSSQVKPQAFALSK
jgi:hypothetical protein